MPEQANSIEMKPLLTDLTSNQTKEDILNKMRDIENLIPKIMGQNTQLDSDLKAMLLDLTNNLSRQIADHGFKHPDSTLKDWQLHLELRAGDLLKALDDLHGTLQTLAETPEKPEIHYATLEKNLENLSEACSYRVNNNFIRKQRNQAIAFGITSAVLGVLIIGTIITVTVMFGAPVTLLAVHVFEILLAFVASAVVASLSYVFITAAMKVFSPITKNKSNGEPISLNELKQRKIPNQALSEFFTEARDLVKSKSKHLESYYDKNSENNIIATIEKDKRNKVDLISNELNITATAIIALNNMIKKRENFLSGKKDRIPTLIQAINDELQTRGYAQKPVTENTLTLGLLQKFVGDGLLKASSNLIEIRTYIEDKNELNNMRYAHDRLAHKQELLTQKLNSLNDANYAQNKFDKKKTKDAGGFEAKTVTRFNGRLEKNAYRVDAVRIQNFTGYLFTPYSKSVTRELAKATDVSAEHRTAALETINGVQPETSATTKKPVRKTMN